jgi:hypothetical protein
MKDLVLFPISCNKFREFLLIAVEETMKTWLTFEASLTAEERLNSKLQARRTLHRSQTVASWRFALHSTHNLQDFASFFNFCFYFCSKRRIQVGEIVLHET